MRILFLLTGALLFTSASVTAQDISGKVFLENGLPAQNYPVVIEGPTQRGIAFTNEDGSFSYQAPARGEYQVSPLTDPSNKIPTMIKGGIFADFMGQSASQDIGTINIKNFSVTE